MDTVHSLSSLPSTDLNFISVLNRATDEEISQAIDVMENSSGQHKGRITACQRELRKRMKERCNNGECVRGRERFRSRVTEHGRVLILRRRFNENKQDNKSE